MMRCSFCGDGMQFAHGHAACASAMCPLRGLDQCEPATAEGEHDRIPLSAVLRASTPPPPAPTRAR